MKIRGIRFVIRRFARGNVIVTGLRGRGKDLLTANVVCRRDLPYISNIDYGGKHIPLDFKDINVGENSYKNFIDGNVKQYVFPYPKGTDVYISDAGIYLPSQYCNQLNNAYPYLPVYFALSRHTSRANVHTNVQSLGRCWDKCREQSDCFITCNWCKVLPFGFVLQIVTTYDNAEACNARIKPCRIRVPLFNSVARMQAKTYRDNFFNQHGQVTRFLLIYRNKSTYDTHHFEHLLANAQ